MGYNKYELGTINMLYSPQKKFVILHPYLPRHTGHLSTLVCTATFFCPQGGRCGTIRLYTRFQPDIEIKQNELDCRDTAPLIPYL